MAVNSQATALRSALWMRRTLIEERYGAHPVTAVPGAALNGIA